MNRGRTRSRGAQLMQEFIYLLRPDYIGLPFGVAAEISIGADQHSGVFRAA
jgi:hypothetical protein